MAQIVRVAYRHGLPFPCAALCGRVAKMRARCGFDNCRNRTADPRGLHGGIVVCIFGAMPAPTPPDVIDAVLAAFATGVPLAKACRDNGIHTPHVYQKMREHPRWASAWPAARELHAAALVEQSTEFADSDPDPARARNRMIARQWIAARVAREQWGDRVDIAVDQRVSITAALEAADARARPIRDLSKVIDAESADITSLPALTATDNESVTPRDALPDPFD